MFCTLISLLLTLMCASVSLLSLLRNMALQNTRFISGAKYDDNDDEDNYDDDDNNDKYAGNCLRMLGLKNVIHMSLYYNIHRCESWRKAQRINSHKCVLCL